MNISSDCKRLISLISCAGYEAYVVGGCVRDALMNVQCDDIDITTSAKPDELKNIFSQNNVRYIETGIKHGTVTAVINGENFEVTTYRTDGEYKDNRHPSDVVFVTNLKEDLSRRDFTINAMAYNDDVGIVDMFDGMTDLSSKVIRAVGNADKRFKEDALRIMRAIRFASTLGFEIECNTKKAIFSNKELLKNISVERIFSELQKLLNGKNVLYVLQEYRDVLAVIIPEITACFDCPQNTPWHIYDVYTHIVYATSYVEPIGNLRLAAFLHDIGKPAVKVVSPSGRDSFKKHAPVGAKIAEEILTRFKVSNSIKNNVVTLIKYHQHLSDIENFNVKYFLYLIGEEQLRQLIMLRIADLKAHNLDKILGNYKEESEFYQIENKIIPTLDKVINDNEPYKISHLAVNGNDLKSLGYSGVQIGDILNDVLLKIINDELLNNKSDIYNYIKSNY